MARRTATSYRTRTTKTVTEEEDPVAAETVVVTEAKGPSFAEVLIFATTGLLLAAIVLTDYYLGARYGKGILF